ncbi:TolC family protein [Mucilaginibacter sp. SP1R1]|uniref:TolC family protein n=1 Tax=Mucilaginibacter sp. SP1R1 TaxID=2723091 RepID=UPI001608C706|nr:TolC family protein [Mucilaginibacter sp. SP1R1]MBB6148535.1 outer membrane protein TolC [Mucilaginibacter sp. SP1R1]
MRSYSKPLFYGILNLVVFTARAQQKPVTSTGLKLSLFAVWHMVDSYNKTNQVKQLQVDEVNQNVLDSKAERLPELVASGNFEEASDLPIYDQGVFNTPSQHKIIHTRYKIGVDGYLNIYNGNKTNLKITEGEVLKELELVRQQATASGIRLLAAAYYLELKRSYVFELLMVKNIDDQDKQLAKIKMLLQQGVILKSDLLRAELKLSNQRVSLLQIENDILIANQKLNILIGQPDNQVIVPVDDLQPENLVLKPYDDYLSTLAQAYDNRIAGQEKSLSEVHLKNVKANVAWKIGLYSNFQYAYPETFLYPYSANIYSLGVAGLKVSFPISGYYLNTHKQKVAYIEVQKQQIIYADMQDKVRQRLNEAYLRFKEALTKVNVAKVNVTQATENYRIVRNTYFSQTSLITDFLDADVQLLQTNFDLASAQVTAQLQYYQLQNVLGNL